VKTKEPVLCFIHDDRVYFTSGDIEKQWGDGWNDAPYECNAGEPYDTIEGQKIEITKLIYEGDFDQPCTGKSNSGYSIETINKRVTPWLKTPPYLREFKIEIYAGCTISDFIRLVRLARGKVYTELK
jgi:hypothetical protein